MRSVRSAVICSACLLAGLLQKYSNTRSLAIAERPRDASCHCFSASAAVCRHTWRSINVLIIIIIIIINIIESFAKSFKVIGNSTIR